DLIARLAGAAARGGAAFYAALTYDGMQRWTPGHAADEAIGAAFNAHQSRDKGLGPAAGMTAHAHLAAAFAAAGGIVHEAASPWRLGVADAPLIAELAAGVAAAARETGAVD